MAGEGEDEGGGEGVGEEVEDMGRGEKEEWGGDGEEEGGKD